MTPLLSILIPTVIGREEQFDFLKRRIDLQYFKLGYDGSVSVSELKDDKSMTIGEKRQVLYALAKGKYSWQIDDDDNIADNAIELILEAIKQEPDCITFEEYVSIDGKEYKSNHSLSYSGWVGDGHAELSDGFHFWRTPFFKSVIKTEIAKSTPIVHCRFGEDNMFADAIQSKLKTEVHISRQLYRYIHVSSPHNERYGIKE